MDDAIMAKLRDNIVSPKEAYMKAIEKNRFAPLLPNEDEEHGGDAMANIANSGGGQTPQRPPPINRAKR
jgi:hypothetical protein